MNPVYNSKHAMKYPVLLFLLSVIVLIVCTMALPWYTKVVEVNDYFYTISKAGVQITGSLPVTLSLVAISALIMYKPEHLVKGVRLKIIFFTGLWITLYASVYYCAVTSSQYTTPGFGALMAITGGIVIMLICVVWYTK